MAKLPIKLVGLTGLAGSGKDTVANIMATHFGYRKFAFADPLYLEIADAFEVEVIDLNRRDCKETDVPYFSLSRQKLCQFNLDVVVRKNSARWC